MRTLLLYPALLALLFSPPTSAAKKAPAKDAILLSQVKTLTLRSNAKTSHRRVSAIPQLTCTGPACAHYKIDTMRCTNAGSSYGSEDVEWSCTASLPEEFKLGSTDVTCEGYKDRDDEYVLKGSCGVTYRLLLTDLGEEKYGPPSFWGGKSKSNSYGGEDEEGWTWSSLAFVGLFLGVLGWIVYSAYTQAPGARRVPRQRPGGFWGGGWGGGPGGGGGDDPPPPYPGTFPGKRYGYGANEGWRPGFWSGALGGAAAGYMAGNRGNRQEPAPPAPRASSWFGGGGNSGGPSPSSRRSAPSSSSSARHESTGFGSTSRR